MLSLENVLDSTAIVSALKSSCSRGQFLAAMMYWGLNFAVCSSKYNLLNCFCLTIDILIDYENSRQLQHYLCKYYSQEWLMPFLFSCHFYDGLKQKKQTSKRQTETETSLQLAIRSHKVNQKNRLIRFPFQIFLRTIVLC